MDGNTLTKHNLEKLGYISELKMRQIGSVLLGLLIAGSALAEVSTVVNTLPLARQFISPTVENGMPSALTSSEAEKYRIVLTKDAGQYSWLSRGSVPLSMVKSGQIRVFVALGGQGYVEISPTGQAHCPFLVKEHVRNVNMDISYWGCSETFNP